MDNPCIDVALGPALVGFLSDEEDALSASWIDEDELIPLPNTDSKVASGDCIATCDRILFDLIPPLSDCESLLQDQEDDPMLDCTNSSDEEYDISLDNTSIVEFDDIMDFTFVAAAADGDDVSLPFADRFESTIKNLRESMKRSGETRNCLTMKTCPSVIDTPDSVTSVIRRVQESTRFIQKSLYHSNKKIVAV